MKDKIKALIETMATTLKEMVDLVYKSFMENDESYLNRALNKESIVDDLEKEVSSCIVEISKKSDENKKKEFVLLGQIAASLERMGDELRYLMERIEIKIIEKLFFSDKGVEQYSEVFAKMHKSVDLTVDFLKNNNKEDLKVILENGTQIKKMIEDYRAEHMERLVQGICQPRAANIFFDMLDFTGNIARHCTNIANVSKKGS